MAISWWLLTARILSTVEDYVVEIDRETGDVVWELDMKDLIGARKMDSLLLWIQTEVRKLTGSIIMVLPMMQSNDLVLLSARHKDAIVSSK